MAFDEKLAARVRKLLADRSDVTERLMFGGLTFMALLRRGARAFTGKSREFGH